jgi:tetratricopeptide (TPR) repeat protein
MLRVRRRCGRTFDEKLFLPCCFRPGLVRNSLWRMPHPDEDQLSRKNAAHWEAVEEASELLHEERFEEALLALRDALKADPKNPYAYYFLGVCLYETAQLEASRDAYRAALKLSPDYMGARVSLSHVLRMLGDLRGAITEAEEALRRRAEDADALHAAGLAHAARGNASTARRYLNAFLASNPEFEAATEVRAILDDLDRNEQGGSQPS